MTLEQLERHRISNRKYRLSHIEQVRAKITQWAKDNPERKKALDAKWEAANVNERNARAAKVRAEHPEKQRAAAAKYRKNNLGKIKEFEAKYRRRRRYGISHDVFIALLSSQDNSCAICRTQFVGNRGQLGPHVDHDHTTGEVRGLLCRWCNHALGNLREDAERCRALERYINTFNRHKLKEAG